TALGDAVTRLAANGATNWPGVDVVVATRESSHALHRTVEAILSQDYPGPVRVIVVHDRYGVGDDLERDSGDPHGYRRVVEVRRNTRSAGTSGARNCGMQAATAPLLAFCDVGDLWLDHKLRRQVAVLRSDPAAAFVTTGIRTRFRGHSHDRVVSEAQLDLPSLLRGRLTRLHPSTFVMSREAVMAGIGLLDETSVGSRVAALEFLTRAARWAPLRNLPAIGVEVARREPPTRAGAGTSTAAELAWLLDACPEFSLLRTGEARITGQIAVASAVEGDRRGATRWASMSLSRNIAEPRGYLALAVAAVNARRVGRLVTSHGEARIRALT
ncbi:MAG: glycosyltransferase family A protein, partial [Actinomycetes bacterium]